MSGRAFSGFAAAAGVALVACVPSYAAEPKPDKAPAAATPEPDALTRAQRDFDTIKATSNGTLVPARPDLPRVAVPEWQGVPAPQPRIAVKPPVAEAKSSTWLIDAMKKESAASESRKAGNDERSRDSIGRTPDLSREKELESVAGATDRDEREGRDKNDRTSSVEVVNPLARYLGEWMTPQDYALLKPGLAESLGRRPEVGPDPTAFNPAALGSGLSASPGGVSSPASPFAAPPSPVPTARENPYLQSLSSPSSLTAALPPRVQPPAPVFVPPPVLGPTPGNTPAPSKIPDFARPASDEKYFKQLKRF